MNIQEIMELQFQDLTAWNAIQLLKKFDHQRKSSE